MFKSFIYSVLFILLNAGLFAQNYNETGNATFYNDNSNGRRTSSGERFNNKEYTAAHRSLPFNTIVRVTNLDNNKSVEVRINDRGPFKKNRIIDITKKAANEIDMLKPGTTKVKIEIVDSSSAFYAKMTSDHSLKDSVPSELYEIDIKKQKYVGFGIQVASYLYIENMLREVLLIRDKYDYKPLVHVVRIHKQTFYRIIIGPFDDRELAEKTLDKIRKKGNSGFVIDLNNLK